MSTPGRRSTDVSATVGGLVTPSAVLVLHHSAPRDVWLDVRRGGICSSDLPAVLGLSGFTTPLHIYYDKRGLIPHDDTHSEAAHFGLLFEGPLAHDWARRNRTVVQPVGIVAHTSDAWQMCSLDRLCTECPLDRSQKSLCALEVKTRNAFIATLWRSGPPDDVLAQVLWQILVTGLDHIHVVCLIGGQDYRQYTVRRDDHSQLVAYLDAEAYRWWYEHIVPGIPPAITGDEPPDALIELYGKLHPDRDGVIELDRQVDARNNVYDYLMAVADKADAEQRRKQAYARMVANLGGAQMALVGNKPFYSIEHSTRRNVDLDKLQEQYPAAYAECVEDKPGDRISIPHYVRKEHAACRA
ncbi:MAG: YqaJ viral recombinase family protein [Pseudonocardiaceae bacterium]